MSQGTTGKFWRYRREVIAFALFAASLGFTIWLGVLGASDDPPSSSTAALLVVLAGVFQVAGGTVINSIGKADPTLARSAVRRLLLLAKRADQAERLAQSTFEKGNAPDLRKAMGVISVHLSYIEEGVLSAVDDWQEFHQRALEALTAEDTDG